MTYRVVLTKQARADLEAVHDLKTREAIRREISALSTNPAVPQRKMGGRLQNYYRVRAAGQTYRIVYSVVEDEVRVLVVLIGPCKAGSREDVYVEAERRLRLYQAKQQGKPLEGIKKPKSRSPKKTDH